MSGGFKKKPEKKAALEWAQDAERRRLVPAGKKADAGKGKEKTDRGGGKSMAKGLGGIAKARSAAGEVRQRGRPREAAAPMPIFDTMAQCAAATGVPLSALKMAKAGGCEAFRHGRVEFGGFIRWFFAQDVDGNTDWVKENRRLDALIKRVKLEELRHRVIDFKTVNQFLQGFIGQFFFGQLERIGQEFPAALKGCDENTISKHVLDDIEKVKLDLAAKLKGILPK